MSKFYLLEDPQSLVYMEGEEVYRGKGRYGLAEWAASMNFDSITCPVNPDHRRAGKRLTDLVVILPSPRVGDFVWTWYSECVMTDRVLNLFREAGLTGFEARPVVVQRVKRLGKYSVGDIPRLWELVVTGTGGDALPESGIRLIYRCEGCGWEKYSSYQNDFLVDEAQWDGSDFFTVNGYPKHILVTERVKDVIVANQLTNCMLIPSENVRWGDRPTPEEFYERNYGGTIGQERSAP